MNCLHCGDCCRRFSPLTQDERVPCPQIVEDEGFVFCGIYERRPEQCVNHDFPGHRHCPIGIDVLGIQSTDEIRERIDGGWLRIKARGSLEVAEEEACGS